jgi:hypothetical protein
MLYAQTHIHSEAQCSVCSRSLLSSIPSEAILLLLLLLWLLSI